MLVQHSRLPAWPRSTSDDPYFGPYKIVSVDGHRITVRCSSRLRGTLVCAAQHLKRYYDPEDLCLRRLKLHGMKQQKVPKIRGLKKHPRIILWLAKNQAVFETPKELLCKEFWPFLGPDGFKYLFFGDNGLSLARGLAQRAVHCPSKVR